MPRSFILAFTVLAATPAAAQPSQKLAADFMVGYAGFVDEALIGHGVAVTGIRYQLSRRVSIGPEVVYMVGPGHDRDLFLTINMAVDFLVRHAGSRTATVNPFVIGGGGIMRHANRVGTRPISALEGAWTAGAGARFWLSERAYAIGEYRLGWEPHVRVTGGLGFIW